MAKAAHAAQLLKRFEAKYIPVTESGCWLWTAACHEAAGYGQIWHLGKVLRANRVSWTLYRGEIPGGLHVCHTCDVRCCVNPDHLFLGTREDNMQDCFKKGRSSVLRNSIGGRVRSLEVRRGKTHCKRGHPLFGENMKVYTCGGRKSRQCQACSRVRHALRREKREVVCLKRV